MSINTRQGRVFRSAALFVTANAALSACNSERPVEQANEISSSAPEERALPVPKSISPEPAMDRAALLAAVARAASAHAAGQKSEEDLTGRRFLLKIRFGCKGSTPGPGPMRWVYDEPGQRLTIRATPDIDAEAALEEESSNAIEAVEGFWIPQPWLLTDACPADPGSGGSEASEPTVGIAQYFTSQDSRVQRRSRRSYEIVRRTEPAIMPPPNGFNLVLEGRLARWPEGGVISCRGSGGLSRPACIVSAEFDRVAFENPETGLTVAQWSAG
jgi:hypothetical protein